MRGKFAGGDPHYIRTTQYGTTDKLAARQRLHLEFSVAPVPWFSWMTAEIPWRSGTVVEVGCGPGSFWQEGRPPLDGPLLLTDLSAGMVGAAVPRTRAAGYTAHGCIAPAQALPIADAVATHVICNHMLYHVPHPPDAVAELARIACADGLVTVATNGRHHMAELKQIEAAVFSTAQLDGHSVDQTVRAFGLESGRPLLDAAFEEVELRRFVDELRPTDPRVVVDYLTSYPPGEDATPEQYRRLTALVEEAHARGDGVFAVTKDVGVFFCRGPKSV